MIYKKIVIPVCTVIALFCSCGTVPDETSSDSVTSVTEVADVTTATNDSSVADTSSEENTIIKDEDETYADKIVNELLRIKVENIEGPSTPASLYDLDSDGISEVFFVATLFINEMHVYKFVNNTPEFKFMGTISFNSIRPEHFTVKNLTLYYDKQNDEYFYVSEYDVLEKWYNFAEVNKYVFNGDEIIVTNIARCDFEIGYGDGGISILKNKLLGEDTTPIGILMDISAPYYDGVEEYLSQFEKIKEITYEELTAVSIKDAINSGTLADYLP